MLRIFFGGDSSVFMKPLCRMCGFLTPECWSATTRYWFPYIIKVGSMKKSSYSPGFDKLGYWCLLSFFAFVMFLSATLILNTAEQICSLAAGSLNWILNKPSFARHIYMTFLVNMFKLHRSVGICCIRTILKLFLVHWLMICFFNIHWFILNWNCCRKWNGTIGWKK